jgi:hypothetical protein
VFRDHVASFAADYDARYAKKLGNFRIERISRVATRFLTCGDYPLSGSGVCSRRGSWQGVASIRCSNPEQSHAEPMSPQAEATEPSTVSHAACRSAWARLIAKVYEIDLSGGSPCPAGALARREGGHEADSESPLLCPRCGSEMRLIAVITDPMSGHRTDPVEVRTILRRARWTAVSFWSRQQVEAARWRCSRQPGGRSSHRQTVA